jgi:hypothetical protein
MIPVLKTPALYEGRAVVLPFECHRAKCGVFRFSSESLGEKRCGMGQRAARSKTSSARRSGNAPKDSHREGAAIEATVRGSRLDGRCGLER